MSRLRGPALVFIAALALRLSFSLAAPIDNIYGDALQYDAIAMNLVAGQGFSLDGAGPTPLRAPGYPFFLALIYSVFGHSLLAVVLVQALLGSLCALLVFDIAVPFLGRRGGLLASWLYALYPVGAAYCGLVLSETLFTFMFLSSLALFGRSGAGENKTQLGLSSFVLGLTALIRATTILFPGVFFLSLLAAGGKPWRGALIISLCFAAAVLPWTYRNHAAFGVFLPVAVGGSTCLYATGEQAAGLTSDYDFTGAIAMQDAVFAESRGVPGLDPYIAADKELKRAGMALIRKNQSDYWLLVLRRIPKYWFSSHSSVFGVDKSVGEYRSEGNYAAIAFRASLIALHSGLAVLAAAGIWMLRSGWRSWSVLALTLLYFNMHALFDMCPRYLVPVSPYLLIFCAAALSRFPRKGRPAVAAS